MAVNFKFASWLFCSAFLYSSGVLFFCRGFLLTRREIGEKSHPEEAVGGCCGGLHFDRVVLLVVDALRYDFALYDNQQSPEDAPAYVNRLPVFRDLMSTGNGNLYKFVADPPTTTMQRLKALMTGSLPTFVDAGANFASTEIREDNLLDQLNSARLNVTFAGDDTWLSLFPRSFAKSFPFPSFDVWDLDTVDRGVEHHLLHHIHEQDWNLLIGHCLGVDHCGHRYGPEHPSMRAKLNEVNKFIEKLATSIGPQSLLIVAGDHGMTRTGDHGGDTDHETGAALFVYSPALNFRDGQVGSVMSQVDLVPTLSVLMGVAIPFSNLGSVNVDLLRAQDGHDPWCCSGQALVANAGQVWRFLEAYDQTSASRFPDREMTDLRHRYERIMESQRSLRDRSRSGASDSYRSLADDCLEFLSRSREMCRSLWVHFDTVQMCAGLALFGGGLAVNCALCALCARHQESPASLAWRLIPALVLALSYASNSYVVEEPYVAHYLAQFLLWLPRSRRGGGAGVGPHQESATIACSIVLRCGLELFRCREEQHECRSKDLHRPLDSVGAAGVGWRLVVGILACGAIVALDRRLSRAPSWSLGWLLGVTIGHWLVQAALEQDRQWILPVTVYASLAILLAKESLAGAWSRIPSLMTALAVLLAGDGQAPGVALTVCSIALFTAIESRRRRHQQQEEEDRLRLRLRPIDWSLYGVLSVHGFFATGHHTSFSTIAWEAAFVGLAHDSSTPGSSIVPAGLVAFSTCFSVLAFGMAVAPVARHLTAPRHLAAGSATRSSSAPESWLVVQGSLHYILFHCIRLMGCMAAAALHRRHLMVWKIFAPRFMFDLLLACAAALGILCGSIADRGRRRSCP